MNRYMNQYINSTIYQSIKDKLFNETNHQGGIYIQLLINNY